MASQQGPNLQSEQQVRDELPALNIDLLEANLLKWITAEDAIDKAAYVEIRASYIRLCRIRREKVAIAQQMKTGGRVRKRNRRSHKEHNQRILDDYCGTPAVPEDGKIIVAEIPAWQSL